MGPGAEPARRISCHSQFKLSFTCILPILRRAIALHLCVTSNDRPAPYAYRTGRDCALLDTKPSTKGQACS